MDAELCALPDWALHASAEMAIWSDITPAVSGLVLPILAVAGEDDPVYGPAFQQDAVLSVFRHARLVTVSGCGPGLPLERPKEIGALPEEFLAARNAAKEQDT